MSDIINLVSGYPTSRDYAQLIELMKRQSVVCIVDYRWRDSSTASRDVAHTVFESLGPRDHMAVSARGISYVHASDAADFIKQCAESNLEFLVPGIPA